MPRGKFCGSETLDSYLGRLHRCGLPLGREAPNLRHVHHCKLQEAFGECGYGWIDGLPTHALDDWLSWGWRVDPDYKGPSVEKLPLRILMKEPPNE